MVYGQKDTSYNEIGLHAQNIDTIVSSVADVMERAYEIFHRRRKSMFCPPVTYAYEL